MRPFRLHTVLCHESFRDFQQEESNQNNHLKHSSNNPCVSYLHEICSIIKQRFTVFDTQLGLGPRKIINDTCPQEVYFDIQQIFIECFLLNSRLGIAKVKKLDEPLPSCRLQASVGFLHESHNDAIVVVSAGFKKAGGDFQMDF